MYLNHRMCPFALRNQYVAKLAEENFLFGAKFRTKTIVGLLSVGPRAFPAIDANARIFAFAAIRFDVVVAFAFPRE